MLPQKTIRNLKATFRFLCSVGSVPYSHSPSDLQDEDESNLQSLDPKDMKLLHYKFVYLTTILHTIFLAVRLIQAYFSPNRKFFLMFMHFTWSVTFIMISWLHGTILINESQFKAFCNGLFKFYGSDASMPGASLTAKERRKSQRTPCVIDFLVFSFFIGAISNVFVTVQVFLIHQQSHQFVYSTLPPCWRESSRLVIIPFIIYETVVPGVNWALMLFFIIIHLVHLLSTRHYLIMLRKNTRNGILKLDELLGHYRSIQILHNHYNRWIAAYMPLELSVVISLTYAGNIGTLRTIHLHGHVSISEMTLLPMISFLSIAFQMILYSRAGDLHHVSSYFSKSAAKGSKTRIAKLYLKSCPPLCVEAGNVLHIQKYTVVRFIGTVIVGTARLSVLFFNWKVE